MNIGIFDGCMSGSTVILLHEYLLRFQNATSDDRGSDVSAKILMSIRLTSVATDMYKAEGHHCQQSRRFRHLYSSNIEANLQIGREIEYISLSKADCLLLRALVRAQLENAAGLVGLQSLTTNAQG